MVSVAFSPTTAATATLELEVRVAQFGFEPFVCRVRGGPRERSPRVKAIEGPPRPGASNICDEYSGSRTKPRTYEIRSKDARGSKTSLDAKPSARTRSSPRSNCARGAKADAEALVAWHRPARACSGARVCALGTSPRPRRSTGRTRHVGQRRGTRGDGDKSTEELIDGVFVPRKLRGAGDRARLGQKPGSSA